MKQSKYITPNWPAPENIHAFCTTRLLGCMTVNDNQKTLSDLAKLPAEPNWLKQVHDNAVVIADQSSINTTADGSFTRKEKTVCVVRTADCLPILICNKQGTEVAALHGGWRSLSKGIIKQGTKQFSSTSEDLIAWLGPAIGPDVFEVGDDVHTAFTQQNPEFSKAFRQHNHKWLANIFLIAEILLKQSGINHIYSSNLCTYSNPEHFFSYRRNNQTGRMASLIWIE